ncbi:MAG: glucosylglycerol hydrolase [Phormidesmis sp.]
MIEPLPKATDSDLPSDLPSAFPNAASTVHPIIELDTAATEALSAWAVKVAGSKDTYFEIGQKLARRLGAHPTADGLTEIGFWAPELAGQISPTDRSIYLEVFTPMGAVDFSATEQTVPFRCDCVEISLQGEFVWAVVSGMQPGARDRLGSLYWLRYRDVNDGELHTIRDVLPYSLPYGVFAPAELYDIESLQQQRRDRDYFAKKAQAAPVVPADKGNEPALPRETAPANILQLHIPTASSEGTLAGLANLYRQIAQKIRQKEPLTPAEQHYVGYDALQLLPTEPTIEYRSEDGDRDFFSLDLEAYSHHGPVCALTDEPLMVTLRKPDTQNWGYDVPILGSSTTNPSLLSTLRPDEVIDFIAEMHDFPEQPIRVIYDLVYGHSDNQAINLLSRQFFAGPNMYGQDLSHTLPMVRAILLEMQRRKVNTGIDGIRIDGGQDFKFFNPFSGRLEYDDNYLLAMSDVVQEINGHQRLMFTIFEDGRPWPEPGWETTSTYHELTEMRPDAFQWGPLIFAHNTPALKGFWDYKWPRVQEVMLMGDRWITGCGNHDTVRRGNQVDPEGDINWNLGETLPEVLNNAYDNPATTLWVYGFSPGLPMDFLNALMHSGWGFFRNTDDIYGVKVMTEELNFLNWQVTSAFYEKPQFFKQLKQFGFENLSVLKRFSNVLADTMQEFEYDLDLVARNCRDRCLNPDGLVTETPTLEIFYKALDASQLKDFSLAFMEDCHEFSRVSHYFEEANRANTAGADQPPRYEISSADITPSTLSESDTSESLISADACAPDQAPTESLIADVNAMEQITAQKLAAQQAIASETSAQTSAKASMVKAFSLSGNRAAFNLAMRQYRRANPWLAGNISGTDRFNRISEGDYTLFYGVRSQPDPTNSIPSVNRKQIAMIAHMGGGPAQTAFFDWLQLDPSEWNIVITSPGLDLSDPKSLKGLVLEDGQAVLLEKKEILT